MYRTRLFRACLLGLLAAGAHTVVQALHIFSQRSFVARQAPSLCNTCPRHAATRMTLFSQKDADDSTYEDWRDFRAKLVLGEQQQDGKGSEARKQDVSSSKQTDNVSSLPQQWAYESGQIIEPGSVILSKPRPDFGYGLRQQYFQKSVILVLSHDESFFTRGIILNRPSNMILSESDTERKSGEWRVWFGGECQGMNDDDMEIVCLHSIESNAAEKVSTQVIKGIKYTTFEHAKDLVADGEAEPSDFWLFAGYAGWGKHQLMQELAQESWIMVTTDSQTVLKELSKHNASIDPRDAGLDTWKLLMDMIGKGDDPSLESDTFDDLMLREWARQRLLYGDSPSKVKEAKSVGGTDVHAGLLVRASSQDHSPFLLLDQDMHKCIVLITYESEEFTAGVYLNHPSKKVVNIPVTIPDLDHSMMIPFIQRYGGKKPIYGEGEEPILWLHCNEKLRNARIGMPFNPSGEGIWQCTADDIADSLIRGLALPRDFLAVSGGCVWEKRDGGKAGGMRGEIWGGKFEAVSPERTQDVWETLLSQNLLSTTNIDRNIEISKLAWTVAGQDIDNSARGGNESEESSGDKESHPVVFNSAVKVSDLADMALRRWVATFLLGAPNLPAREVSELE